MRIEVLSVHEALRTHERRRKFDFRCKRVRKKRKLSFDNSDSRQERGNLSCFEKTINYALYWRELIATRTKRRKTTASVSYIRNVDVMVADLCHAMPTPSCERNHSVWHFVIKTFTTDNREAGGRPG